MRVPGSVAIDSFLQKSEDFPELVWGVPVPEVGYLKMRKTARVGTGPAATESAEPPENAADELPAATESAEPPENAADAPCVA